MIQFCKKIAKKLLPTFLYAIYSRYYHYHRMRKLALQHIQEIKKLPNSPFKNPPSNGFLRGIDFYSKSAFIRAMVENMMNFCYIHGKPPDFVSPKGFSEKILWREFFGEIKVPESGNKLLTSQFIPPEIRKELQCPPIIWHSTIPKLPKNDEIHPGYYYVKASHGTGMFQRIHYPLAKEERIELEKKCKKWLHSSFGLDHGEWWYNTFTKEILIEEDVVETAQSTAYDFYVFQNEIGLIILSNKPEPNSDQVATMTQFDSNFVPIWQPDCPPVSLDGLSDEIKQTMKSFALKIGQNFSFVRVDFLLGKNNKIYLLELTFSPSNGLSRRPTDLDLWLGKKWALKS